MTLDTTAESTVRQLRKAGVRPNEALVRQIMKLGEAAFPPLLELATDLLLFEEEEPLMFAPIHALRLLGELPQVAMIEPLLREYPVEYYDEYDEMPQLWATEVPQMLGKLGAAAIEPLFAVADSDAWAIEARAVAIIGLANAATFAPEQRDAVIAGLRERLQTSDDTTMLTNAATGLASLGVADAYGDVMARFRAGKIDKERFAAATARQLLLTGGEKALTCIHHPLQERYDKHGPKE